MKNLKKVLSLALVFAMVLGLCIGAMAADTQDVTKLTDWDSVTHKEAATLLNAFNIMQGYPSGTFQPERTVTRAEAVKMIDVGLWGGVDQPELFTSYDVAFTDVKTTDWYAGHVTYAQAIGILDGFTDGTFRPNDTVTGFQMLKMALIALNYSSEAEGLTGSGWDIRTMRLATDPTGINLTDGLDEITNWNAPLTRDQAAQIIYNMIQHNTVKYQLTVNGQGGYVKEEGEPFGEKYLDMKILKGVLVANTYAAMLKDQYVADGTGNYEVTDKDHFNSVLLPIENGKYVDPIDINTDTGLYDLGSSVTVYQKNKTSISVVVNPATVVTNPLASKDADTIPALTVGTASSPAYTQVTNLDTDGNGKINVTITVKYDATISDVKAVIESTKWGTVYQTGTVAWRDAYETATTLPQSIKAIKFVTGTPAVKDDKVLTVASTNGSKQAVTLGAALETVEGTNTRINNTTTGIEYYIDGVKYTDMVAAGALNFGAAGVFYTYPGSSNIVTAKISGGAETSVALIYDAGYTAENGTTVMGGGTHAAVMTVAAILPDGTKGTYTVTQYKTGTEAVKLNTAEKIKALINTGDLENVREHNDTGVLANTNEANYLVEYYLDEDGNMIITKACTLDATGIVNQEVKTTTTSVTVGSTSKFITPETITFVQTSTNTETTTEDWAVYVGRTASYKVKSNGKVDIVLGTYNGIENQAVKYATVEAKDLETATGTTEDFYYVIADHGQISTNYDEFVVFDASTGKVNTINVAHASAGDIDVGEFYTKYADYALTEEKTFADGSKGYVTSFANDIIVVSAFGAENAGEYPFEVKGAYVVNEKTKFFILGDEETSAKITAAEVAVQGPTTEPTKNTENTQLKTPYQAIVVSDNGVATTVILFAEEKSIISTIGG